MQQGNTSKDDQVQKTIFWLKPYTLKELCYMYDTTVKTFHRWLRPFAEEIGARNGRYFSVLQVQIILKRLGMPVKYYSEESRLESLAG